MNPNSPADLLGPDDFDLLDEILDDLRQRAEETPQWEFCEGFLAALVVSRRAIALEEYLPVLLDLDDTATEDAAGDEGARQDASSGASTGTVLPAGTPGLGCFADAAQKEHFLRLWQRRWSEIAAALDTPVESLDDERAYHPEVMDVRGAVAALEPAERAEMEGEYLPSFAQVWALGFMFAVENWSEEWAPPRDKQAQKWLDASLQAVVALTEDDQDPPTLAVFDDAGVPSVSVQRFNAFADAVWAIYDLREMWRGIGPRVETVRREATPGRNDLCHCGSGKKFKKCHGA